MDQRALEDRCRDTPALPACQPAPAAPVVTVNPATVAREASLELTVPKPGLFIGPDPKANKWNMLPIGMPVWIGDNAPDGAVTKTVTRQGITITMNAVRTNTKVTFGDGTTISCNSMTVRPAGTDPQLESPDCGHTYSDKGSYTVTATSEWTVTWQAAGQTGTVALTSSTAAPLDIGELSTVLVPGP